MKKLKKFLTITMLLVIGFLTTACGNKVTQRSLENTYYQYTNSDQGTVIYLHFEPKEKLKVKMRRNGELLPQTMNCKYKVVQPGEKAKVELNLMGKKETVDAQETKQGLQLDKSNIKKIDDKTGKEIFK